MSVRVRNVSPFAIGIDVPGVGHVEHGEEVDVPEAVAGRPASDFRPATEADPAHLTHVVVDDKGEEHVEAYDPGEGLLASAHWERVDAPKAEKKPAVATPAPVETDK